MLGLARVAPGEGKLSEGSTVPFLPSGLARYGGAPGGDHCAGGALVAGPWAMWQGRTHLLFVKDLHGIVVPGLFVLHQHHPPEGARAESLDSFKLIQVGCVLQAEGSGGSGTTPTPVRPRFGASPLPPAEGAVGTGWSEAGEAGGVGGRKNKMAESAFLKAGGRVRIQPWPGAQELLAAAWGGAGAAHWKGVVGWRSLAMCDQVPP